VLFSSGFDNIVEWSRRADVEKALILVRCPHNAVATVTLAFARGTPGRRDRPRPRRSAQICLWRGPGEPRCRRGGCRGAPSDRFMCMSSSWRPHAGQEAMSRADRMAALFNLLPIVLGGYFDDSMLGGGGGDRRPLRRSDRGSKSASYHARTKFSIRAGSHSSIRLWDPAQLNSVITER
jgi:hypothetical protein